MVAISPTQRTGSASDAPRSGFRPVDSALPTPLIPDSTLATLDLRMRLNSNNSTSAQAPAGSRRTRLVLASNSPRRRELLTEHGLEHDAIHPGIDDASLAPTSVPPEQWVSALAYLKAQAGAARVREMQAAGQVPAEQRTLVLGADTTCVRPGPAGNTLVGTPRTEDEARDMLRAFSGGQHTVVTGVAIIDPDEGTRDLFSDSALVRVGRISDDQIENYLRSGEWRGKAGAYNLRERINDGWPIEFDGDPATIMGLPMRLLVPRLNRRLRDAASAS